ncbi:DUF309 domain-containing protein [Paenibacillus arenosi]|uniref:DUF309 domain-containing protein n=1 Tax=Paenibacillus arenosi TaxID=2774142 RepID=A0ABR9AYI1_9BACL|nr:DUF309 domain-containing protein [Paenibacillus arenosi]MBD8498694.1 DUF309 domain-containing protein [Paenibacillus arenosi]
MRTSYDRLFVRFLKLFNEHRDYYACHDVMEELWLEEGRKPFYQGLLQVAVGLHHWHHHNTVGAIKLWEAALHKLSPYPDNCMGIALGTVRIETALLLELVSSDEGAQAEPRDITIPITDAELIQLVSLDDIDLHVDETNETTP